jgi:hypothetical protein
VIRRAEHSAKSPVAPDPYGRVRRAMACLSGRFAKETNHVNDAWRIRAVGQGYGDDLQQFVERHGVTVES